MGNTAQPHLERRKMNDSSDISNNSGPGSAAEPSMEEILASIRRILKEDDGTVPPEEPEDDELVLSSAMVADDELVLSSDMVAVPADISTATELPAEIGLLGAGDEPAVAAYQEPVHFAAVPEIDTHAFDAAPAEAPVEPEPEPEPEPTAPAAAPHREEIVMEQHVQGPDGLIGDEATSAIASTVGQLMRSISTDRNVSVSRGGLTIEDIVREEIKPMLRAWFDSHLPSLVERIVRAEIGRVIDRMEL